MQSVLVIDSDKAFAQELCAALGARGLAPEHSEDASGAVALAEKLRPHLIVLSVELPRANGFTVCNKLKKVAALREIPVVLVSSESSEEAFARHRGLATPAQAYVREPVAVAELVARIEGLMGAPGAAVADPAPAPARATPPAAPSRPAATPPPAPSRPAAERADAPAALAVPPPRERERSETSFSPNFAAAVAPTGGDAAADDWSLDDDDSKATAPPTAAALAATPQSGTAAGSTVPRSVVPPAPRAADPSGAAAARTTTGPAHTESPASLRPAALPVGDAKSAKELVATRERLARRDKELADARAEAQNLKRRGVELFEKIQEAGRTRAELSGQLAELRVEKDGAARRAEELRARLARTEQQLERALTQVVAGREALAKAEGGQREAQRAHDEEQRREVAAVRAAQAEAL
ncbi:MAG: response regulator, partial [Myxococcales bacterium]|nr:response regulator [Myxococcales bacterium]